MAAAAIIHSLRPYQPWIALLFGSFSSGKSKEHHRATVLWSCPKRTVEVKSNGRCNDIHSLRPYLPCLFLFDSFSLPKRKNTTGDRLVLLRATALLWSYPTRTVEVIPNGRCSDYSFAAAMPPRPTAPPGSSASPSLHNPLSLMPPV